jgi:dual oxidase
MAQHVFHWLLERHRTHEYPQSPITGLVNPTHFGRLDIKGIEEEHYEDMCKMFTDKLNEKHAKKIMKFKVVVFIFGPPVVGQQIADHCRILSAWARNEKEELNYCFMVEVFG